MSVRLSPSTVAGSTADGFDDKGDEADATLNLSAPLSSYYLGPDYKQQPLVWDGSVDQASLLASCVVKKPSSEEVILESCSANLWDADLGRSEEEMHEFHVISDDTTARIFFDKVYVEQDITRLGVLTHLLERGLLSGEVYASHDINPRDISATMWTQKEKNRRVVMYEAAVNMESAIMSFDIANEPISLHYYEVEDTQCMKQNRLLKSRRTIRLEDGIPNAPSAASKLLSGFAKDRNGIMLSGRAFKRLLAFFNYKWVRTVEGGSKEPVDDDQDPTASELIGFGCLFQTCDMSTLRGFNDFLAKFSLKDIFEVKPEWTLQDCHYYFGVMLRSLVNVRVQAFDGQHRFVLISNIMIGYLEPFAVIPRQREKWKDNVRTQKMDPGRAQFSTMCKYNVGVLKRSVTSKSPEVIDVEALNTTGRAFTEATQNVSGATWNEFINLVYKRTGNPNCQGLIHDPGLQYWLIPMHEYRWSGTTTLINNIWHVLEAPLNERYKGLVLDGLPLTDSLKTAIVTCFTVTKKLPEKPVPKLSTLTMAMFEIIRACAFTPDNRSNLSNYFEFNTVYQQRKKRLHSECTRATWLQKNVYMIAMEVTEHIMKQLNVERYIISQIKLAGKDTIKRAKESQYMWNQDSTDVDKLFPAIMTIKTKQDEKTIRTNLFGKSTTGTTTGPSMAAKLFNHLQLSVLHTLINDIIHTINIYGVDPDFQINPVGADREEKWRKIETEYLIQCQRAYKHIVTTKEAEGYTASDKKDNCMIYHPPYTRRPTEGNKEHNVNIKYHLHDDVEDYLVQNLEGDVKDYHLSKQKNRILREYLTLPKNVPFSHGATAKAGNKRSKKTGTTNSGTGNEDYILSIETLLNLFVVYIKESVVIGQLQLKFFKNYVEKINFTQNKNGFTRSATGANGTLQLGSMYGFLPTEQKFSQFVKMVLTDEYDVSDLDAFKTHVAPTSKIMEYEKKLQKCETKKTKKSSSSPIQDNNKEEKEEERKAKEAEEASKRRKKVIERYTQKLKVCLTNSKISKTSLGKLVQHFKSLGLLKPRNYGVDIDKAKFRQLLTAHLDSETGTCDADKKDLNAILNILGLENETSVHEKTKNSTPGTPSDAAVTQARPTSASANPYFLTQASSVDSTSPIKEKQIQAINVDSEDEEEQLVLGSVVDSPSNKRAAANGSDAHDPKRMKSS